MLRDQRTMQTGDLISGFMRRIGRGDRVIVVLSAKYLRSPYCMTELNHIFERSLGEQDDFLRRIVPVVLDCARFTDWRDRRDHARHWKTEFQEMEPCLADLGVEDVRRFQLMRKWYANIGDILAFLADQLAPRGIDAIVADDFRAIRELLERGDTPGPAS